MDQFDINVNKTIFFHRISQSDTTIAHQFKILPIEQQNVIDKVPGQ